MQAERTPYTTSEFGLALSLIAVLTFAGCGGGGSTNSNTLSQIGGGLQGTALNLTGAVSTIAGSGAPGAADNSVGTLATFRAPAGITSDGLNLYVADVNNHEIRRRHRQRSGQYLGRVWRIGFRGQHYRDIGNVQLSAGHYH